MSSARHSVLIVDDEPAMLGILERVLSSEGYRILTAQSPAAALKILDAGGVDLMLSDVEMPEMSGLELLARVRRSHPDVVRILLTGGASFESAVRAINDGEVYRYLTKPFDNAELRDTVQKALARLDELRRSAATERTTASRQRMLAELEREHPGIGAVVRVEGFYVLDADRLDALALELQAPGLSALLGP